MKDNIIVSKNTQVGILNKLHNHLKEYNNDYDNNNNNNINNSIKEAFKKMLTSLIKNTTIDKNNKRHNNNK